MITIFCTSFALFVYLTLCVCRRLNAESAQVEASTRLTRIHAAERMLSNSSSAAFSIIAYEYQDEKRRRFKDR